MWFLIFIKNLIQVLKKLIIKNKVEDTQFFNRSNNLIIIIFLFFVLIIKIYFIFIFILIFLLFILNIFLLYIMLKLWSF